MSPSGSLGQMVAVDNSLGSNATGSSKVRQKKRVSVKQSAPLGSKGEGT